MSLNCKEENKAETKPRATFRGNTAALLANLLDSDSDSDDSPALSNGLNKKTLKTCNQHAKKGIYSQAISETKQNIKATHNRFDRVDKQIIEHISEVEKENVASNEKKMTKKKQTIKTDYRTSDSSFNSEDQDSDSSVKSSSSTRSSSSTSSVKLNPKKETKKLNRTRSPSPPPPPSLAAKKKRKSTTKVDRQLKELDKIKSLQTTSFNSTINDQNDEIDDEVFNLVTVRVSTRNGVQKYEINKNDPFLKIYENISKLEKTGIENIVLVLKEKKINHMDTPESINLQIYDIIEINKIAGKKVERIQIIDKPTEETTNEIPNTIVLTFQTCEGRKSRVTFLIFKDEPFKNVLKKYCEHKELVDWQSYMMEFDGEKVDPNENSIDLDLDGDEIFDVKKNSKVGASLDVIKSNKNNYEFDDDILIA